MKVFSGLFIFVRCGLTPRPSPAPDKRGRTSRSPISGSATRFRTIGSAPRRWYGRGLNPPIPRRISTFWLAGVYVPKSNLSAAIPSSHSPRSGSQPPIARKASKPRLPTLKTRRTSQRAVSRSSSAGRDYFRVNLARRIGGRHQCIICTTANGPFVGLACRGALRRKDWTRLLRRSTRSRFCLSGVRRHLRNRPGRKTAPPKGRHQIRMQHSHSE